MNDQSKPAHSRAQETVFIGGVSRSGTSTFADLLRAHRSVAMGRERYSRLIKHGAKRFDRTIFDKERFCIDLRQGDTHHKALGKYYHNLLGRFDRCSHVGDKIPNLNESYDDVFSVFPDCKIFFMIRNIFDVAASYESRVEKSRVNPGKSAWPTYRDSTAAVSEWNKALEDTLQRLDSGAFFVVEFEQLYQDDDLLDDIFAFISLPITEEVRDFWQSSKMKAMELDACRRSLLSSAQKRYIMHNTRFDLYKELVAWAKNYHNRSNPWHKGVEAR